MTGTASRIRTTLMTMETAFLTAEIWIMTRTGTGFLTGKTPTMTMTAILTQLILTMTETAYLMVRILTIPVLKIRAAMTGAEHLMVSILTLTASLLNLTGISNQPSLRSALTGGGRLQTFLDDMKATSFFSIPSHVFDGVVPSGGSPVVTVDMGETFGGMREIDFSSWTPGLAALRAVLYLTFLALAVRIVILKH